MGPFTIAGSIDFSLGMDQSAVTVTYLDRRGRAAEPIAPGSLRRMARSRARGIEANVPTGSTVVLAMPHGPEFLLTLLGCLYAGVIAVPVPDPGPSARFDRLDGILSDLRPAAILCIHSNRDAIASHMETMAFAPSLVVMDAAWDDGDERQPVCAGLSQSPDETVIIQYTSGSTRHPRGVAVSGRNILCNAALVKERWRLSVGIDVLVNWLPHYHDMGLMGGLLYPLIMGGPSVQMSTLGFVQHPLSWLRAISTYRGTVSGGPAFGFGLCLDTVSDEDLKQLDLSCWQTAFCGAEPVPAALLERFRSRFRTAGLDPKAVYASYGLAEATLLVAGERDRSGEVNDGDNDGRTLAACRLSPETRENLRIVDPETRVAVADGVIGEIWVSGPSVARGYWRLPDDADPEDDPFAGALEGSPGRFLRTGDLGWIGPAGLHISGRLKDVLIVNGSCVAAVDIEWLAAGCDENLNPLAAAAVSVSRDGPDDVTLLIEVKTNKSVVEDLPHLEDKIRRTILGAFGIHLHFISIVKRGSLERTTSGKVRRQAVATRLRAGHHYTEVL